MKTYIKMNMIAFLFAVLAASAWADSGQSKLGADEDLVAWAFLNYEPEGRSAEERALMLKRLGFTKCGYEGHPHLVGQLEEHLIAYKEHGIEMIGIYLSIKKSNPLEEDHIRKVIEVFEEHTYKSQLWLTIHDSLFRGVPDEQRAQVASDIIRPLADRAIPLGCKIGLYNHGGWTGLQTNQIRVIRQLQAIYDPEVFGIVLNFHHAHPYVDDFPEQFRQAQPYLFLVNTNGMRVKINDNGERVGNPKILGLGKGDHEADMLRVVRESGYIGPIGVIDHMKDVDPEENLRKNLTALKDILKQLESEN